MIELLKIEYLKIKHYTAFRAFMLLFLILVPLSFYGISLIEIPIFFPSQKAVLGFPGVWKYLGYIASWWTILPGILVIILMCNEVVYKTEKQNVIDGLSRREVILSKFYLIGVITGVMVVYIMLVALVFGLIFSGTYGAFDGVEILLHYLIQTLGYLSMAMLLAVLLRKTSLSVLAFLIVFFVLGPILNGTIGSEIGQWTPMNVISGLTPFPLWDTIENLQRMEDPSFQLVKEMDFWVRVVLSLIYATAFVLISNFVLKKRDL